MSKSINLLIVIIISMVVVAACILNIAGLLGGLRSGTTAEWADLFKWDSSFYMNTYTTIDSVYIGEKIGEITNTISRSVDTSVYVPSNGEATYLKAGTDLYEVTGYDSSSFICVDDNGDFFLYCTPDSDPDGLINKCGENAYKSPVEFVCVSIPTVSETIDDPIVRIRVLDSVGDFKSYLDRYKEDFRRSDGSFTYNQAIDDRGYDSSFFKTKRIIAIYVPEGSGRIVYSVSSLMADKTEMTLVLKKTVLPVGIKYDTSDTRHIFLEIDAKEYSNQKLTYQIEPSVISNTEVLSGVNETDIMNATVKAASSLDDLLMTKYEPLVKGIYTREFFERNMLIIVECSDSDGLSKYTLNNIGVEGGFLYVNIDRMTDEDSVPDPRMQYILVPFPKSEYNEEVIIPSVCVHDALDPEEDTTYVPETDEGTVDTTDETVDDVTTDEGVTDEERIPEDYTPRDLTVIDDTETVKALSDIYGINVEMYGESFFESYVLLFVGDVVASESVAYRYNSCTKTEEGIEIVVDKIIPSKCSSHPASKYIAIPYLIGEYNGEQLKAKLNTIYEWEISENDNNGQPRHQNFNLPA